jgi:hypothetical protein
MGLFNNTPRIKRSHGHRSYNKLIILDVLFDSLLPFVKRHWVHITFVQNFTLSLWKFYLIYTKKLNLALTWTPQHRDIDLYIWLWMLLITEVLFGLLRIIDECELKKPRKFLHLKLDNKGIDAVKINNILNHKDVVMYFTLL